MSLTWFVVNSRPNSGDVTNLRPPFSGGLALISNFLVQIFWYTNLNYSHQRGLLKKRFLNISYRVNLWYESNIASTKGRGKKITCLPSPSYNKESSILEKKSCFSSITTKTKCQFIVLQTSRQMSLLGYFIIQDFCRSRFRVSLL